MTRRRLSGDHNQCPGCSEYFNSTAAFDKHRIGRFGVDRRCMTVPEMLAAGMAKSKTDWWVTELREGHLEPSQLAQDASVGMG
jgi:hypothetical protein